MLAIAASCTPKEVIDAEYQVIPLPESIIANSGNPFILKPSTIIAFDAQSEAEAAFLAEYVKQQTGLRLKLRTEVPEKDYIVVGVSGEGAPESYCVEINSEHIAISGADAAGAFYGVQTIRKSLPVVTDGKTCVRFSPVTITDAPRFSYRGLHFDCCRHFFSVDFVKKYLDLMALHNINTLHWHLTEDQGWRVEIKKYPALTEVGAYRDGTMVGKDWGSDDGIRYGGFYTQDEIRDVVAYAAARHIRIIPEVDLPGHMLAALASYPELGCTGGPYKVSGTWGVFPDVLCAGNDKTYEFLEDVLSEIADLFPCEYFHIGGDECPKERWEACEKCQARIKELGIVAADGKTAENLLQGYVMRRMGDFLQSKGKKIIGWDELMECDVPDAVVMSWRGESGGIAGATSGHDVIMVPNNYFYFDYGQSQSPDEPLNIGGYVPVEKVYGYEPLTGILAEDAEAASHIIGIQANVWTEYMATGDYVEYMLIPRVDALSEVQWTSGRNKDYQAFLIRLERQRRLYDMLGYNYAKHVFSEEAAE